MFARSICRSLSRPAVSARAPFRSMSLLNTSNINANVLAAKYAVRGALLNKADAYKKQIDSKNHSLPFDDIIFCNIGNPHVLGQKPISFFRDVLALVTAPRLLENEAVLSAFQPDVIARAKYYLSRISGGTGSYTHSMGLDVVREEVARYIEERDGFPSSTDNIYLTDGASPGVKLLLQTLIRDENDGIMIPIPQYPLYSASIALCGGQQVGYYLDESQNWSVQLDALNLSIKEARAAGTNVRALAVINPGNPTGQCMPIEVMEDVVRFCKKEKLVLMADEVYQTNIYSTVPFTSFKKVVASMGPEYNDFELASFHSVSKGFVGECGRRGGYMELHGFDEAVKAELYKMCSISLCSNVDGQLTTGMMCQPPKEGEPSYEQYTQESTSILESLKRRAIVLATALNKLDGVSCNIVEGALYAFPQITLPKSAIEAAEKQGLAPDAYYCMSLLDSTGICVVPGSGFGQVPGTFHFRTTILPQEDKMDDVAEKMSKFHTEFMAKHQ